MVIDHRRLENRRDPNAHPQYHLKGVPFTTTTGPTTLACIVRVLQSTSGCRPIVQVFPYDATDLTAGSIDPIFWLDYAGVDTGEMHVRTTILPEQNPSSPTVPVHYCGYAGNEWKGVHSQLFQGQWIVLDSASVALSSGVNDDWDPSGGSYADRRQIYRITPAGAADLCGMVPFGSGGTLGPCIDLINVGSFDIRIRDTADPVAAGSSVLWRFLTGLPGSPPGPHIIGPNDTSRIWYDTVTTKWRILK